MYSQNHTYKMYVCTCCIQLATPNSLLPLNMTYTNSSTPHCLCLITRRHLHFSVNITVQFVTQLLSL